MKNSYFIFTVLFSFAGGLWAELALAQMTTQSPMISPGMTADEIALRAKARRKMYPGGSDEEPLKVQAQLPTLKSKFVSEDDEAPPPAEDTD